MYEEFFGLRERPFLAAARVDRYFPAATIEQARQTLTRSIDRADGIGIVVGPSGTGKSLLCQVLAEQLRRQFKVAHLSTGRLCSPRALMQGILYELGLPYRDMSEGELRLSLVDHLEPSADCPNGMLLIVDEAHSLPLRLFEEIRMITNFVRDGMPRVRLVLAGNGRLEERLNEPRLDSFSQRVIARCYLESLSRDDTMQFVRAQFAAAGGDPDQMFDEDSLVAVQRATDGIPRLINQVCDHALILARTAGVARVDAARIEEAWADLQQLPPPWSAGSETLETAEATIEFGSLDDIADDTMADDAIADDADADEDLFHDAQTAEETHAESLPFVTRFDEAQHQRDDHEELETRSVFHNEIGRAERQLDQIDAQIAQLNSESVDVAVNQSHTDRQMFQPLGSFQPEVEFDLTAAAPDPFSESYDEEEVIIDRYAAMSSSLAGRPQVYSTEGRAIADALAPHDVEPPSPRLASVDESEDESVAVVDLPELAESIEVEIESEVQDQSAPGAVDQIENEPSEPEAELPLVVIDDEQVEEILLDAAPAPVQQDIVEPESSVTVVQPNQFGNLFTNLRRNTGS